MISQKLKDYLKTGYMDHTGRWQPKKPAKPGRYARMIAYLAKLEDSGKITDRYLSLCDPDYTITLVNPQKNVMKNLKAWLKKQGFVLDSSSRTQVKFHLAK